jgi:hypothetical protein
MHNLPGCVYTGVSASCRHNPHRLGRDRRESPLQCALHGCYASLNLPAVKRTTIVFHPKCQALLRLWCFQGLTHMLSGVVPDALL